MTERIQIPKRLRFEIFKRDGFVCQYCGGHPPNVTLHCDHVLAVANGGTNDPGNLVTACDACNQGKGAIPLTVVPLDMAAKIALLAERESQIAGYYAVVEAQRERIEAECWRIVQVFEPGAREFRATSFQSIRRFVTLLGVFAVLDAADLAMAADHAKDPFLYFCGICWNWIKNGVPDQQGGGAK